MPCFDSDGREIKDAFRWRALSDWRTKDKSGKFIDGPKYLQKKGTAPQIYLSPLINWNDEHDGPTIIVEGEKKAAAACKVGIRAIGIGGVWNFRVPQSDDQLLPGFDKVLYADADVEVCYDSDCDTNPNVQLALARLSKALEATGRRVSVVPLPAGDGEKVGLDDFLVAEGTGLDGKYSKKIARKAFRNLPRKKPPDVNPLSLDCAADVVPEPILELWPGVMYRKKVTLIVGEPGLGKSITTNDIAARVSTAADWPGGESAVIDPSDVVILNGEDDHADTVVPRSIAAKADLNRIHLLGDVVKKTNGTLCAVSLDSHAEFIHQTMLSTRAKLLVIDPVGAFMGDKDSNNNSAIRALINKLRQNAIAGDYAVLLITHFNKPGDKASSAIHRVMGSLGFVAAARSVFAFVRDPTDPDYRLLLPIKNNLGGDQDGYRCRIEVDTTQRIRPPPPFLVWDEASVAGESIDEVMAKPSPQKVARKEKEKKIEAWLRSVFNNRKKFRSPKFDEMAKEAGLSKRILADVMAEHGFTRDQDGYQGKHYVFRPEAWGNL